MQEKTIATTSLGVAALGLLQNKVVRENAAEVGKAVGGYLARNPAVAVSLAVFGAAAYLANKAMDNGYDLELPGIKIRRQ
ncbi:hypothetical protein [Azotobacter vinelandii]|uniref:hypothetical protein n=1 Tax=Azotobacter vinelandii TaxID=354 RepID=UPI0026659BDB|nr:hypothetical protein [Azotobacter vinelandii]WKN24016.1 hypothetical protein AVAEIV_002154 [Azotobacter vinelandii]